MILRVLILTPWVSSAPEDDGSISVLLGSKNVMELDRKAVEVSNVQRTEVMVESVVEESIIDGEVARSLARFGSLSISGSLRSFPGRL